MYIDSDLKKDEFGNIDKEYYIEQAHALRSAYVRSLMADLMTKVKGLLSIDLPVFFTGPLAHK